MIFVILFDMLLLVFIQAILSFVLSRKTINISNDIARKYGNFTVKDFRRYETWEIVKRIFFFFSELGLSKGASIKTCFIGTGAALENLPYDLSDYLSVLEHLVKYLIIWASFLLKSCTNPTWCSYNHSLQLRSTIFHAMWSYLSGLK